MATLAETLASTTPVSVLLRKARRLGLRDVGDMMELAVMRGCRHYRSGSRSLRNPPGLADFSDEELAILLLLGENPYEPAAIRCAAQIARSPRVGPARLSRLAVMEKTERVLAHIARAGTDHDSDGSDFWRIVLSHLPPQASRQEPDLPHWSRFVSMPGRLASAKIPGIPEIRGALDANARWLFGKLPESGETRDL